MNSTYTYIFTHLTTMKLDGYFVERCMVYSKEKMNDQTAIDTLFDIQLTAHDLQTLPMDDLKGYFSTNPEELTKRISFENWENASHIKDEDVKKEIIEALFDDEKMEYVFEKLEDIFESFRFCQEAIKHKQYKIDILSKKEIEVIINGEYGEEIFLIEIENDVEDLYVRYFAFYVDEIDEPVAFFNFLPSEIEKAFFDDVLKFIRINEESK